MAQDSTGYMWLASLEGLFKYNGTDIERFNKNFDAFYKGIFTKTGQVFVDKNDSIWIITSGGVLEKFDRSLDEFRPITNIKDVSKVYEDSKRNMWIATHFNGIYRIGANSHDTIQISNQFTNKRFFTIVEDLVDDKIIVAGEQGLLNIDPESLECTSTKFHFSNNVDGFNGSVRSNDNSVWLSTFYSGLYLKSVDCLEFCKVDLSVDLNSGDENLWIYDLTIDKSNKLWIASYQGLYVFDPQSEKLVTVDATQFRSIPQVTIRPRSLYSDNSGVLWTGLDQLGPNIYDPQLSKFNAFIMDPVASRANLSGISAILKNSEEIWLGETNRGILIYNLITKSRRTLTTANSKLSSNRVVSLQKFDSELWIGHHSGGLDIINENGVWTNYDPKSEIPLSANGILDKVKDSKDRIWLGTRRNGLIQFDKNRGVVSKHNFEKNPDHLGFSANNIKTLVEGKNGDLWLGTDGRGLIKFNPDRNETVSYNDELSSEIIRSLYYDHQTDVLWIGTYNGGLMAHNTINNTWFTYGTEHGLPNLVVNGILQGNKDEIWISTKLGISKINTAGQQNLNELSITNFDLENNLQDYAFDTGAYHKDHDGILYFGGHKGVNWFDPKHIEQKTVAPKTIISKVEVFNELFPFSQNDIYKSTENSLTFSYSALEFSYPEKNQYQYRLQGHNKNWIEAGNNKVINYGNLGHGDYTFEVKSSNYDGVWSEVPATYSFTIKPPWYLTNLAKVLYALLLLTIGIAIYRYLKWRWKIKTQLQLEHAETERLKKLDEFRTRLYTNISHEFRTPLSLITGPLEHQLEREDLSLKDKKELQLVNRSANRLVNLTNQILDLAKLESGSVKLKVKRGDLSLLLNQILRSFQFAADEKNIEFAFQVEDMKDGWFDHDVIEKIATNLLSNAVKYAPDKGKIMCEALRQNGHLIFSVSNNGNTLSQEDLTQLFERYHQEDDTSDGFGIGLSLVKELVDLSRGNVVGHIINEDEIQFAVSLPIKAESYDAPELVVNEHHSVNSETFESVDISSETESTKQEVEKPVLLIVEDEPDLREFLNSILDSSFQIILAENGRIGIDKAESEIPDIIISDIMMPQASGIELCNHLKQSEMTSHIPIILLTAKAESAHQIEGLETGADDYITKPFSSKNLQLRVQNLIDNRMKAREKYGKTFQINSKEISVSSAEEKFLNRLKSVLEEHLTNPDFNAGTFVEKMTMSRMQLHRKLKALTGLSATEFLRTQRLALGAEILQNGDVNVSQVGYSVGFNNHAYFSKCFKEQYHCTPSEYAKK